MCIVVVFEKGDIVVIVVSGGVCYKVIEIV